MTTLVIASLLALGPRAAPAQGAGSPQEEVRRAEAAFAQTMADRDHAAFVSFLADETVFFGSNRVLRGKDEVAAAWKPFYEGEKAPFSWRPEQAEVLASGGLGFTSGPVFDPAGKRVGTFNSVWRRQADGQWRIVFDKGCPPCDCGAAAAPAPKPSPRASPVP
jgi:ketosteroid isomerase-like protein